MNLDYCHSQLLANAKAIQQMVETCSAEQAQWKPSPADWSILEVINHLVDEEREDFPFRLRHLLAGSSQPWPAIRPAEWVTERAYNQRDLGESIQNFMAERQRSLEWLPTLAQADGSIRYPHPPLHWLSVGDLLASWVAHDLLHLRQLVELKYAHTQTQVTPYTAIYAGDW
jgi:hypothetical protein